MRQRQYIRSHEKKSSSIWIVFVSVAIVALMYFLQFNDFGTTVKSDSESDAVMANDAVKQSDEVVEEVMGVEAPMIYSHDSFFSYIQDSYSYYEFDTSEEDMNWTQNGVRRNIPCNSLLVEIGVGDYEIESVCRETLLSYGFEVSTENAGGSDAGGSLMGFSKGSEVCIIQTSDTASLESNQFKVSCGVL